TVSKHKDKLLESAQDYHHAQIYVPGTRSYLKGFLHQPGGVWPYHGGDEPIVDPEGLYDLDASNAWLTVNQYNARVLNTSNMLIADIDFGGHRLNRFAGARSCDDVIENLSSLALLDEHQFGLDDLDDLDGLCIAQQDGFRFTQQTYRVYRTHSGCRVICTSA